MQPLKAHVRNGQLVLDDPSTGWISQTSFWPGVKLRLGKRLLRQVERKESWLAENRPAAPDLFAREFRDTLAFIRTFFVVDEKAQTIDVLAIWGAARERSPKL